MYLSGFPRLRATGTSLAVVLPAIGLAATIESYCRGNIDLQAAIIVAATLFDSA